jgi:MFS family permease
MLIGGFWAYLASFTWLVFATHTWEVFVALGLMGAGASPLWPAALARLTRGTTPRVGGTLGRVFSTWFLGGGIGIAIATLVSRAQHPISLRLFIAPLLAAALLGLRISPEGPEAQAGPRTSPGRALAAMVRSIGMLAVSIIPQIMAAGILIPIVVPYLEFFRRTGAAAAAHHRSRHRAGPHDARRTSRGPPGLAAYVCDRARRDRGPDAADSGLRDPVAPRD